MLISVLKHRDVPALIKVGQNVCSSHNVGTIAHDKRSVAARDQVELLVADDDALNVVGRRYDGRRRVGDDKCLINDVLDHIVVPADDVLARIDVDSATAFLVLVKIPLTAEGLLTLGALEGVPVHIQVI